jgi:hypothetical protein
MRKFVGPGYRSRVSKQGFQDENSTYENRRNSGLKNIGIMWKFMIGCRRHKSLQEKEQGRRILRARYEVKRNSDMTLFNNFIRK